MRLIQTGVWDKNHKLMLSDLLQLLTDKINQTDFYNAKGDILPFIKEKQTIALWFLAFFLDVIKRISVS